MNAHKATFQFQSIIIWIQLHAKSYVHNLTIKFVAKYLSFNNSGQLKTIICYVIQHIPSRETTISENSLASNNSISQKKVNDLPSAAEVWRAFIS